ncbi:MAG TPA: hypothetical protein VMC10_04385 [Stellaceae bacterium]|nr:hypothetical protein [Stellaceae bacterium]
MEHACLAGWTPVFAAIQAGELMVDWGDLGDLRFSDPFFDQTVERWAGGNPPPELRRTGAEALEALDGEPSLDPDGIICHLSRCGSTLLSRQLASVPGMVVASEPGPINALLLQGAGQWPPARLAEALRLMVRAIGRRRHGDERHFVLKLSSWNIRQLTIFRRAFPGIPVVWVQRAPLAVATSLLDAPAGWMQPGQSAAMADAVFGPALPALAAPDDLCLRALAALLTAAREAAHTGRFLAVDYRELPAAAWSRVAPFLNLPLDATVVARMVEEARYDAKEPGRRPFAGSAKRAVPNRVRALVARHLTPLYEEVGGLADSAKVAST